MKIIHTADWHIGQTFFGYDRFQEHQYFLDWLTDQITTQQIDVLLISGDIFDVANPSAQAQRQFYRFLRRVTEQNPGLQIILIAGNHDYIGKGSPAESYEFTSNTVLMPADTFSNAYLDDINVCVTGFSFGQVEYTEDVYADIMPQMEDAINILLAHGGDASHLPFRKTVVDEIGFDYVALGHIHKPEVLIPNRMAYAGALEPIDRNDIGAHGFVRGILDPSGCRISFVEHAEREYVHLDVPVDEKMTGYDLHTRIDELIGQRGVQNMYCLSLEGRRDPDVAFDLSQIDTFGNVLEIADHTRPAYDYEKLLGRNQENLLGRYIASFEGAEANSTEYAALCEGVQALLDTRREQA